MPPSFNHAWGRGARSLGAGLARRAAGVRAPRADSDTPGSNYPFSTMAVGDQPAVERPTRAVINGENVLVAARVRVNMTTCWQSTRAGRSARLPLSEREG